MSPSQQRQLKWWLRFWAKVGGAFLVTMICLANVSVRYREATELSEKRQAAIRAAVASGMIQATPIQVTALRIPTSTIITTPPTTTNGGTPPPGQVANPVLAITVLRNDNGTLTLTSPASVGVAYALEASLDLRAWETVSTNTAVSSTVAFALSNAPVVGRVFYRMRGPTNFVVIIVPPGGGGFVSPVVGQAVIQPTPVSTVVSVPSAVAR